MANEKRLIYIDDAVKKLEKELDTQCEQETDNDSVNERFIKRVVPKLIRDVINWLEKQPTVEAEEVVRCKDCKYYGYEPYDNGDKCCVRWEEWIFPFENDFCSCGERKDNG